MESSLSKLMTPDNNALKMKEKSQHIQVFVRVRPMNSQERVKNSLTVLDCPGSKEVVVKERSMNNLAKTFTFDKVFGPNSKQIEVYKSVVAPLIEEVLLGYNCTVFAYGQTGTGKTFTMEGARSPDRSLSWDQDPLCGIVPRALNQIFDELRVQGVEFTVRVSLLELYNEELFDLLAPAEDAKLKTLRLFEDTARKGSVVIPGLEEVTVHNKHEVYDVMEKGSLRRQTAATLMNDKSSRSHTVFTVTVHIKECNMDGEELLKIGKLNLVDLAGSENIGRSGAVDKRAREAGNINQSLLTLGRVITCLVERAPHVPYRESKLTRLLQDSLGGRTKTSIIATVSPASINLEETLSTLDYAHRAKNITNRPEINQKLTKKAMLQAYTEEIEQLKKDLQATREKNGVFVEKTNYERMMAQLESQGQDIAERITIVKGLEDNLEKKEEELTNTKVTLVETQEDLTAANEVIDNLKDNLRSTQLELKRVKMERDEKGHLVSKHVETENKLSSEAHSLLSTAKTTTVNLESLYSKLERKKRVEESNLQTGRRFRNDLAKLLHVNIENIGNFRTEHAKLSGSQRLDLESFLQTKNNLFDNVKEELAAFSEDLENKLNHLSGLSDDQGNQIENWSESLTLSVDGYSKSHFKHIDNYLRDSAEAVKKTETHIKNMQQSFISTMDKALKQCTFMDNEVKHFTENLVESMNKSVEYVSTHVIDQERQLGVVNSDVYASKKSADAFHESIKNSIIAFQTELTSMLKKNEEFSNGTEAVTTKLLKETEAIQKSTHSFAEGIKDQIAYRQDLTAVYKKQNNDECNKLSEDMEQENDDFMSKFDSAKQSISHHSETTSAAISAGNKLSDGICEKIVEECKELIENTSVPRDAINEGIADAVSTIKTKVVELEVDSKVSFDTDSKMVQQLRTDIKQECEFVSSWAEKQALEVSQQSGMLSEYFDSTYLIDLPTGATPQRKVYEYPITLSATSPHEAILNRFRKTRKVSLPTSLRKLDDSDLNESSLDVGLTDNVQYDDEQPSCSSTTSEDSSENVTHSSTENITVEAAVSATAKVSNPSMKTGAPVSVANVQIPKIINKENTSAVPSKSGKPEIPKFSRSERKEGPVKRINKGPTKDILQTPN